MKRVITLLSAIILITAGSSAMAAMSISNVRKNARFLSDRMAYELRLTPAQYNDIYEINYDFMYSVRHVMNDVVRGYDPAIDRYYYYLDLRNEDLRWVLSNTQYRRFMANEAFYRPIYTSGSSWNFRVYITYHNHNHFYFGKPTHYRTYSGRPAPPPGHVSRYHKKYNHTVYNGKVTVNNRRSDFHSGSSGTTSNSRRTGQPVVQKIIR
ncbi:MAG: hypothetical protein LUE93_11615 [Bacteroides sp.]|nr:hypothetical protein [Bacteroides sp.]